MAIIQTTEPGNLGTLSRNADAKKGLGRLQDRLETPEGSFSGGEVCVCVCGKKMCGKDIEQAQGSPQSERNEAASQS